MIVLIMKLIMADDDGGWLRISKVKLIHWEVAVQSYSPTDFIDWVGQPVQIPSTSFLSRGADFFWGLQ